MKLALSARIVCDPKHLLESRWVHDTAHVLLAAVREAQDRSARRGKARRN